MHRQPFQPLLISLRARPWHRILTALVLLSGALFAIPTFAREWHFDVSVDGLPVGTHDIIVNEKGDARTVQSDMRYGVALLGASYKQHAEETWQADCLTRIDTRTEEKGRVTTVAGRLEAGAFIITGASGEERLAPCVMSFAYWNPKVLRQTHLVNSQTGAWTTVTVHDLGKESVDVRGASRTASHYRIELWYAPEGEWVGLRSTTRDGHVLSYRLK